MSDAAVTGLPGLTLGTPLGRGGMGAVYAGTLHEQPVAVKVLTDEQANQPAFLDAFRTEVRAMATLSHPSVVQVLAYGVFGEGGSHPEGSPFVVMERAPDKLSDRCGQTPWPVVRTWLVQLLEGLAHAHARGITHRDLKPANVLLADEHVKIVDFGLARAFETFQQGKHEQPAGTPGYMPPEQRQGRWRDVGPWTDLYALGRLALDLVTLPRGGTVPVPATLGSWVSRLRQERIEDRYERAADALAALRELPDDDLSPLEDLLGGVGPAADSEFAVTQPYFEDEDHVLAVLPEPLPVGARTIPPSPPAPLPPSNAFGVGLSRIRTPPLVGREDEKTILWEALHRANAGNVEIVVLRGPPGVGKRELAMWMCHEVHETGAGSVDLATHQEHPGPRTGMAGMVARELRCFDLDRRDAYRRLSDFLERYPLGRTSEPDTWEAAALLRMMSPALGPGERPDVSLGGQNQRFELFARFLEREAGWRVPLVWLDHLHFAHGTLAWLDWLRQRGGRFLVLATVETGSDGTSPIDDRLEALGARVIDLPPLPLSANQERLTRTLGLKSDVTAAALATAVDGDVLLAGLVLEDWREEGLLDDANAPIEGVSPPGSVDPRTVWRKRIDAILDGRDRYAPIALAGAAVLGMEVNTTRWKDVLRRARVTLAPDLAGQLLSRGLAVPLGLGGTSDFRFADRLVRELLLERSEPALSRLNRAAALSFRVEPETVLRRAFHLEKAGDIEGALVALKEACSSLMVIEEWQLLEDVVRTLRSTLERLHNEEAAIWADIGEMALRWHDTQGAELLDDALEVVERAQTWSAAHGAAAYFAGRAAYANGKLDVAEELLRITMRLAGTEHDGIAAEAEAVVGVIRFHQARFDEALDILASATERRKDPAGRINGAIFNSVVLAHLGDEERAEAELASVEELVQSSGWMPRAAYANALGERARRLGDFETAGTHYAMGFSAARVVNSPSSWVYRLNQALAEIQLGRTEGVAARLDEAIEELDALDHRQFAASGRVIRLVLAAREGDLETWDALVDSYDRFDELGTYDADLALCGELAAEAMLQVDPTRAERAARFANRQRSALEGQREAASAASKSAEDDASG